MLNKKTIKDIAVNNKKVLVRCDFNVPLDRETKSIITSDKRIVESLPTIKYLISAGAKVVLCSHLGKTKEKLSLKPVAQRLSELLEQEVIFIDDCISEESKEVVSKMKQGEVVLLENVRMYEEEERNEPLFAKFLAKGFNIFVNDAFGSAHRAHASTVGVTQYLPSVCGFLIEKEIDALDKGINSPARPLVAIIGGAKVSSKIAVLENLLDKVDTILIGGAMSYTFSKALGFKIGNSLCEEDKIDVALEILEKATKNNINFLLPIDNIAANEITETAIVENVESKDIPDELLGVDIGEETIKLYTDIIMKAGTVVWNGPVGVFEIDKFSNGTQKISEALANTTAITIIGGGDSAAAIEKFGFEDKVTHVSTGGGASLEFMEGKILPGIDVLEDKIVE